MNIPQFQKSLLRWYSKKARDLPWRRTRDPYAIWVSEIMLQQTQVTTVIPYYEKWMKKFPTLQSLARAPLDSVLHAWAGLGYYRRARMLHQGAQEVLKNWNGKIPERASELQKIPGIGRYTAGAIASIAFEEKSPLVDGNVIRVFSRLKALRSPVDQPSTLRRLWKLAEDLLPDESIGNFNQALMELGSQVCTPQNPRCETCPVHGHCKAYRAQRQAFYPVRLLKEKMIKLRERAFLIEKNSRVLIQKQTGKDRWSGLWIFPNLNLEESLRRREVLKIKHGFTKYLIDLRVYQTQADEKIFLMPKMLSKKFRWVKREDLKKIAFPSPHQKIANYLLAS